jgi:hypothetical protein
MVKPEDKALEMVSGGWGYVKQTNTSMIILKNFDAGAKYGSMAGLGITVTQANSN